MHLPAAEPVRAAAAHRRTEALRDGLRLITLLAQDGSRRPLVCLRVDLVPGWLAGVTTSKIEDEALRKKLITYQRDLYKVAWAVFGPLRAEVVPASYVQAIARRMAEISNCMEAIDQAIASLNAMLRDVAAAVDTMKGVTLPRARSRGLLGARFPQRDTLRPNGRVPPVSRC